MPKHSQPTSTSLWDPYFEEGAYLLGYHCALTLQSMKNVWKECLQGLHLQTQDKAGQSSVKKTVTLPQPPRPWSVFWKDFQRFSSKRFHRFLSRFVLPVLETVAKWQIVSWLVLTAFSAGFQLPYVGFRSMMILGAGICVGCGYHQYRKNIDEEHLAKAQKEQISSVDTMLHRLKQVEHFLQAQHPSFRPFDGQNAGNQIKANSTPITSKPPSKPIGAVLISSPSKNKL